jgi:N-acetyl-alpha-D-glucosaminyl L-malate synthase BshA
MKIAFLVYNFPPNQLSGAGVAVYNIAKHLAFRGHEVHVITVSEVLPMESIQQGFFIHRIPKRGSGFVSTISFWIHVSWMLSKLKPDIISAQSVPLGVPGLVSKILLNVPCVVWGQGSDIYLQSRRKNLISEIVLRNADAVIALTEDMKRRMMDIFERNVYVVPNGIDLDRFRELSSERCRAALNIRANEKIIISVGRLHPIKGHKYLIESLKTICKQHKDVQLILVGDGEEKYSLELLVEKLDLGAKVKFVGAIKNEDIPKYMAASDIFVLPSLSESFGIVNLEAMASGLPIVASKVGGVPEIVIDGENGFLVEPESPKEIAEKVTILLEDDELRKRISIHNKTCSGEYEWDNVVKKLEEIYKIVV